MKSLLGAVAFSVSGFSGPVVGLLQGFNFPDRILVAPDSGPLFMEHSTLVPARQTAIQTAALIILLLFCFNILSLDLGPFFKMIM